MGSARAIVMKFLVLLSIVSLACGVPMPEGEEAPVAVEAEAPAAVEEEAPAALPYVHDATGDVAEPYVHEEIPAVEAAAEEEIAAEPYVHDATGDVAEEYVHVEPVVPAVAPVAPAVTYAAYPYAGAYAGHAVSYPYAVYHTGCVNNVGSIVPCA